MNTSLLDGVALGRQQRGDRPPRLPLLPLPRRRLRDSFRVADRHRPFPSVVDPNGAGLLHLPHGGVPRPGEAPIEVGGGAGAAEGVGRGVDVVPVRSGAKDEGDY